MILNSVVSHLVFIKRFEPPLDISASTNHWFWRYDRFAVSFETTRQNTIQQHLQSASSGIVRPNKGALPLLHGRR